jgi:hypothetical protein
MLLLLLLLCVTLLCRAVQWAVMQLCVLLCARSMLLPKAPTLR